MQMQRRSFLTLAALSVLGVDGIANEKPEAPRIPVLVELFTSQGCSSCPAADELLSRLILEQPVVGVEVIGLSLHVDYWDRLGWNDPYASPMNSRRQLRYQQSFRTESVYTPQMVVDGVQEFVGSDVRKALAALRAAATRQKLIPEISVNGQSATISVPESADVGQAELVVALLRAEAGNSVLRGENRGRTLLHRNVAYNVTRVGLLNLAKESHTTLKVPSFPKGAMGEWRLVAFLQETKTLRVVGVQSVSVPV